MSAGKRRSTSIAISLSVIIVIAALAVAIWLSIPKGFDTDLSKIGNGQPALVFVYERDLLASARQTEEMNRQRAALEEQVQLLIADTGHPAARDLMARHQVEAITFLLFDARGSLVSTWPGPTDAAELRRLIEAARPELR